MPHVSIKHFPRELTDEQREKLVEAVTAAVVDNLDTYEGAVSIALEPVPEDRWNAAVVEPEISGRAHLLVKAPDYGER